MKVRPPLFPHCLFFGRCHCDLFFDFFLIHPLLFVFFASFLALHLFCVHCFLRFGWWVVFEGAAAFNADISKWNVAKVTKIIDMFKNAQSFNQTWCAPTWLASPIAPSDFAGSSNGLHFCCSPGEFYNTDKPLSAPADLCEKCDSGQYTNAVQIDTACTKCPRDSIASEKGLSSCGNCTDNYFSNDRLTCKICPAGKKTSIGADNTTCDPCNAGSYQDLPGNTSCTQCPSGFVQDKKDRPFCLPCIPGKISHAGTTCSR